MITELPNALPQVRRYSFALYPSPAQEAVLHTHRRMIADLWNALLQRYEDIQRRTQQRQVWHDHDGNRHVGISIHNPCWPTERYTTGKLAVMPPRLDGRPAPYTRFDMQNEITWLANSLPEWQALSIWCAHRTATLLHRAIEAFYRRAKNGAGTASGYPRYKRRDRHDSIPHRFASGCQLRKDLRHLRSWQLKLKGVPGAIHARGIFPGDPSKLSDADVIWRNEEWQLSVCIEIAARRWPGSRPLHIEFDLLDGFAWVNGVPEVPSGFERLAALDERLDQLKSARDQQWPRGKRLLPEAQAELAIANQEITRRSAHLARYRANALHVWTTRVVKRAKTLVIVAPPLNETIASPRGTVKNWGANVETVLTINRHVLEQAPATAIAMLQYKAAETGIPCEVLEDPDPPIGIGGELVSTGRKLRQGRREFKRTTQ